MPEGMLRHRSRCQHSSDPAQRTDRAQPASNHCLSNTESNEQFVITGEHPQIRSTSDLRAARCYGTHPQSFDWAGERVSGRSVLRAYRNVSPEFSVGTVPIAISVETFLYNCTTLDSAVRQAVAPRAAPYNNYYTHHVLPLQCPSACRLPTTHTRSRRLISIYSVFSLSRAPAERCQVEAPQRERERESFARNENQSLGVKLF